MTRIRTFAAWAAVHGSAVPALVLVLVAGASLGFARAEVRSVGPIRLLAPVSALLMLPAVAATAAAIACHNQARLPLPDPLRAKVARTAWIGLWSGLAVLASDAGQMTNAVVPWQAVTRNVLVLVPLAMVPILAGAANMAWLLPVGVTLATILFGAPDDRGEYPWWAMLLRPESARHVSAVVGCAYVATVMAYALFAARATARSNTE